MHKSLYCLLVTLALALSACSGTLTFKIKGTQKLPDADGRIDVTPVEDQGLSTLKIDLEHLAPPDRLAPNATHYVAWARRTSDGLYSRVGALKYNKDKRVGVIEATAPETSFTLTITAEVSANPAAPSANVALEQKVQK